MPTIQYSVGDTQVAVQIEKNIDGYQVTIGDISYHVLLNNRTEHLLSFTVDGQHHQAAFAPGANAAERQLWVGGQSWRVKKFEPRQQRRRGSLEKSGTLSASIPGQIRAVLIDLGNFVTKGTPLIIMEAMKMEMRLTAPDDGVITAIHCSIGDVVERGDLLVVMDAS